MHEYIHPDYINAVHQERRTRLTGRLVPGLRHAEWAELLGPMAER